MDPGSGHFSRRHCVEPEGWGWMNEFGVVHLVPYVKPRKLAKNDWLILYQY